MLPKVQILEEPNVMDDHLLDIMGADFHCNHEKGLAEWIKNSADAYTRHGAPDHGQYVFVRLNDSKKPATIECIDFVGMNSLEIESAFKRWGDPEAAKRGLKKKVYGGHGNGGKFYMRQMFGESYFITYKEGNLNVYGFSKNKKYGFGKNQKNIKISPEEALKFAELNGVIPGKVKEQVLKNETGFTVVRGIEPSGMKNVIKVKSITKNLAYHPQARRILQRIPVSVIFNDETCIENLSPPEIKAKDNFEEPVTIPIPEVIEIEKDDIKVGIEMTSTKYPDSGKLTLKTSEIALIKGGSLGDLNRIEILGELGVLGSYPTWQLKVKNTIQSVFIYGECYCPILEDPDNPSVRNDREKLIENDKSEALLNWIAIEVDKLADKIAKQDVKEQEEIQKKLSSKYNDFLNKWKNQFMNKLFSEITIGSKGSLSGGEWPKDFKGGNGRDTHDRKHSKGNKGGSGDENKKKERKFPQVKLSSYDNDPLEPSQTITLDARQPLIYQRPQDVGAGIFWINTSSPIAHSIIERYGAESLHWRSFLFQRYVDIFVKEALDMLIRKDPESFTRVGVDSTMDEVVSKIHNEASKELEQFLFNETYDPE